MQHNISYQTQLQKITRNNIQNLIDQYSLDQLNFTPPGFNNNLIWNYGHVIVTHQLLVYGLSSVPMRIANELVDKYRKGTKPEQVVSQSEFDHLKKLFTKLPEQAQIDYGTGLFNHFKTYQTSYGVTLNSTEEGIHFNNLHEAMHFGNMLAIRKFL